MSPADLEHWEQARAWLTLGNVHECFDALERSTARAERSLWSWRRALIIFTKAKKWDHAFRVAEALQHAFPTIRAFSTSSPLWRSIAGRPNALGLLLAKPLSWR